MKIVVNEFGSYLSKKENRFVIKTKEKEDEYSADQVEQIIISSPSSISEGVVKLAIENNIDIVYTSYNGKPFARIYPCTLGGTTLTRREQAKAYFDERGALIVKEILRAKLENQLFLIKRLNKTRNGIFTQEISLLEKQLKKIRQVSDKIIDDCRQKLLGYEGYVASVYFSCLNKIIPFGNREPKANDIFNIALNYGYGILYLEVERACILSGLDPYLGFLHVDRYGKPSMVLDLVEQFRPLIDRAIINLFVRKQISENDLETIGEAIILTKSGRKKIIEEVMNSLSFKVIFNKKKLTVSQIILEQGREIARFLLAHSEDYKPFVWR
ncbi:MAG: CRISPR-associated endonuclease Cas1 [Nanoarchaeota archaeon]